LYKGVWEGKGNRCQLASAWDGVQRGCPSAKKEVIHRKGAAVKRKTL
jgi:hypothetical protein